MADPLLALGGCVEFLVLTLVLALCSAFLWLFLSMIAAAAYGDKYAAVESRFRLASYGLVFVVAWIVSGLAHLNALDIVAPLQFREAQEHAWDLTGTFLMALAGVGAGVLLVGWITRRRTAEAPPPPQAQPEPPADGEDQGSAEGQPPAVAPAAKGDQTDRGCHHG